MVRKFFRKKSKRLTCHKRYKIEKKVRDHNRKLKKERKKNPSKFRRKDPGVPNCLPFKDKILEEAENAKKAAEEEKKRRKKEAQLQKQGDGANSERKIKDIDDYLYTVDKWTEEYNQRVQNQKTFKRKFTDNSLKTYCREFKKVVEAADVILEVLDARDPQGTRCLQVESTVISQPGKRLVLILNKVDLVPKDVLEQWLKYLRREYPTVLFKSNTQSQDSHLSENSKSVLKTSGKMLHSSKCLGADVLIQLLKNYCRNKGIKTAITVGVVGLPNVGKSSLINSLRRSKACVVGSTPGVTKAMQEVHLDSKVRLLDSPGIVIPDAGSSDSAVALRNAIKLEQLEDPIPPVEAILESVDKNNIMIHYGLASFKDCNEFLALLAKRFGRVKKKGLPDINAAARIVLKDWNCGRIKYYTRPPLNDESPGEAILVSSLASEFSLDELKDKEASVLSSLPVIRPSEAMCIESLGPVEKLSECEVMESDNAASEVLPTNVEINLNTKDGDSDTLPPVKKPRWETAVKPFDPTTMSLKKEIKKMKKKKRKERNRNVKRVDELTSVLNSFSGISKDSEDYDFNEYFEKD